DSASVGLCSSKNVPIFERKRRLRRAIPTLTYNSKRQLRNRSETREDGFLTYLVALQNSVSARSTLAHCSLTRPGRRESQLPFRHTSIPPSHAVRRAAGQSQPNRPRQTQTKSENRKVRLRPSHGNGADDGQRQAGSEDPLPCDGTDPRKSSCVRPASK